MIQYRSSHLIYTHEFLESVTRQQHSLLTLIASYPEKNFWLIDLGDRNNMY